MLYLFTKCLAVFADLFSFHLILDNLSSTSLMLSITYTTIIYFSLSLLSGYLLWVNKNRLLQKVCREAGIDLNSSDAMTSKDIKTTW